MKSSINGKSISRAEIANISIHGIWILFQKKEYFLPFSEFPWFKDATLSQIHNVETIHKNHLNWPELDVDINIKILENIESYPLIWK